AGGGRLSRRRCCPAPTRHPPPHCSADVAVQSFTRRTGTSGSTCAAAGLRQRDVAPVEELSGCDFVLEVGSTGGTLKAAGAAARNDWVLATSVDLRASRHVRIALGLELVRCPESTFRPAIQAANEDLFTALYVHTARRTVVFFRLDIRVPAAGQTPRHHLSEVLIPGRSGQADTFRVKDRNPRDLVGGCARWSGKSHQ